VDEDLDSNLIPSGNYQIDSTESGVFDIKTGIATVKKMIG
jgi:hypothetical protein